MAFQTVFITGASTGIGKSIALRFAREGYHVAILGHTHTEELENVKKQVTEYGVTCLSYIADVSSYEEMKQVADDILARWGHLDVLVNNAGIAAITLFTDMTPAEYERMVAVNLLSVMHCCHLFVPSMVSLKSGRIINSSSVWGLAGASCEAVYSATKGGINSFTKALAKELAPSGIAVNAIAFGVIDTDMNRAHLTEEELGNLASEIPAGKLATTAEAADAVWQLSQTAAYLTGQVIAFDGGFL